MLKPSRIHFTSFSFTKKTLIVEIIPKKSGINLYQTPFSPPGTMSEICNPYVNIIQVTVRIVSKNAAKSGQLLFILNPPTLSKLNIKQAMTTKKQATFIACPRLNLN